MYWLRPRKKRSQSLSKVETIISSEFWSHVLTNQLSHRFMCPKCSPYKLKIKIYFKLHSVVACPKEFFNVTWSTTIEGEFATQICPRGASGRTDLISKYFFTGRHSFLLVTDSFDNLAPRGTPSATPLREGLGGL